MSLNRYNRCVCKSMGMWDCTWITLKAVVYTFSVCVSILTLIDLEEGLRELAGEQGFWQISEVLLQHVCHVIGRLALVVDPSPVCTAGFVHLTESLDARFNSRFPENSNLEEKKNRTEGVTSCAQTERPDKSALNRNSLLSPGISMNTSLILWLRHIISD